MNWTRGAAKACALIFALIARPAAASESAEELAARVVDLFVHDDAARLNQSVAQPDEMRARLDELECISVQHVEWEVVTSSEQALTLRIDIDATGTTTAAWRPEMRVPRTWYVEAERSKDRWKIVQLISAERRLALAMLSAPTTAEAECLFADADDESISDVVKLYADEIDEARRLDRMPHAHALAETFDDLSVSAEVTRLNATLLARNRDPAAVDLARRAVELAQRTGNANDLANTTFTLAIAFYLTEQTDRALEQFAAAADMIERLDSPIIAMKSLHMYAWLSDRAGRLLDNLRASERLTELAKRYRWPEGEIVALFDAASVHGSLGNERLAGSYLDEARKIAIALADREMLVRIDYFRSFALFADGDTDGALACIRSAVANGDALSEGEQVELHVGHANVLIGLGRWEEAERVLASADLLSIPAAGEERTHSSVVEITRAALHLERSRFEAAIEAARTAIELERAGLRSIRSMSTVAEAFAVMGRALWRSGKPEEAMEAFRSSLSADEQRVSTVGFESGNPMAVDRPPVYVDLVELLVERNEVAEAFRVVEQMRVRLLRDALERGRVDLSATVSDDERKREESLELRVESINRERFGALAQGQKRPELDDELRTARVELERFRDQMRLAYPVFARRQPVPDPEPRLPEASESLAVVEFVVARKQILAFVLTTDASGATNVVAVPIVVSAAELERRVNELSVLMGNRSIGYRNASQKMFDLVLRPLEKHVAGRRTLCIIPDGPLWSVPFHALVSRDGRFVMDERTVFYASSLSMFRAAMARPSRASSQLIAFGNPSVGSAARATVRSAFRDVTLGPLIDAEKEALSVSRMYGPESRVYVRDGAREEIFKSEAPAFGIVHIAAHAIVDHRAPMYSAIVLAAKGDEVLEDGLLEAREVADLPLEAELAVLSACDTAQGKAGYGDGVIGLGWAFLAAGCPTLVVSQWQAESRSTSELMIEFHRHLRAGTPIADALRLAQLSIRRRYPHPFYWAPFVAVGAAAKPITSSSSR